MVEEDAADAHGHDGLLGGDEGQGGETAGSRRRSWWIDGVARWCPAGFKITSVADYEAAPWAA